MVGGVSSSTTTICWHVAVFPLPSMAVQITTFVPEGKLAGALFETVTAPQLSAATGAPRNTLVALHPLLAATTILLGQVIVGGTRSDTTTRC